MEKYVSSLELKYKIRYESLLRNGSNIIDETFEFGKMSKGTRLESNMNKKIKKIPPINFALSENKIGFMMMGYMS